MKRMEGGKDLNFIVYGEDESQIQLKIREIRQKRHHEVAPVVLDALVDAQEDFLYELDAVSIFADPKLVVLKNASFLTAKNTTKYSLEEVVKRKDCDYDVIYVCRTAPDRRKKLVKQFIDGAQIWACEKLDRKSQPAYVQEQIRQRHLKMDRRTTDWLTSRIGMDPLQIQNELDKLQLYGEELSLAEVKQLLSVSPEDDIFAMVDALFARNTVDLMGYFREFRKQGMEPVAISALLAGQIRFLFQVRVLMNQRMDKEQIAGSLHAHPYRVQVNMRKAADFSSDDLLDMLASLADLDRRMKMGQVDKDDGFEEWILKAGRRRNA